MLGAWYLFSQLQSVSPSLRLFLLTLFAPTVAWAFPYLHVCPPCLRSRFAHQVLQVRRRKGPSVDFEDASAVSRVRPVLRNLLEESGHRRLPGQVDGFEWSLPRQQSREEGTTLCAT